MISHEMCLPKVDIKKTLNLTRYRYSVKRCDPLAVSGMPYMRISMSGTTNYLASLSDTNCKAFLIGIPYLGRMNSISLRASNFSQSVKEGLNSCKLGRIFPLLLNSPCKLTIDVGMAVKESWNPVFTDLGIFKSIVLFRYRSCHFMQVRESWWDAYIILSPNPGF